MPTISTLVVDVETRTRRFSAGIKTLVGGLAAVGAAAGYAFKSFEDSEKITAQTGAVIESTGHAANVTAKQVEDLAGAISLKTGIDDEAIQSGENLLLTFKNIRNEVGAGNDIFDQSTQAITDISVAMGQDFKSSAVQLGKALNDPIAGLTSLKRIGVSFYAEQEKQIQQFVKHNNLLGAQKVILQELSSEFGGSAEAQKTASQTMATALENLAETIGKALAPAITFLLEGLTTLAGWIQDHVGPAFDHIKETVSNAWNAVKPFASAIGDVLIPLFQTMWHTIQDRLLPVFERIKPLLILIGGAIVIFATIVLAQFALVVTAVGFVIDKFLDFVGFVRDKVVEPVVNFLGRIVSWIGDKLEPVFDIVGRVWSAAFEFVKSNFRTVVNFLIAGMNIIIDGANAAAEAIANLAAGPFAGFVNVPDIPHIPQLAAPVTGTIRSQVPGLQHGGLVTRTGWAMVHKGELFSGVNNEVGFGGNIVLNVDGQTFARITRDQLLKLQKRNATSGI